MSKNIIFWSGIAGVTLFVVSAILGGLQINDYSHISQYISESYAIDTPYGKALRFLAYFPCGLLLTFFAFSAPPKFPKSNLIKVGFLGIGIFYGLATVIVSVFPCDSGCNKEFIDPSISQIIHNLTGLLTYIFVPASIIAIGLGLQKLKAHNSFVRFSFFFGLFCFIFIGILLSNPNSNYTGLLQRIIEGSFIIWVVRCAFLIRGYQSKKLKTID
uniref:DUF998 domain-containing protein n=1 Tax=Fulvivirga sp. TaxID=1931237 RepID=UPI00404B8FCC